MQISKTAFDYQAHFFTTGKADTDEVWLLFHGYGQTGADFLNLFPNRPNCFNIALEGLSQFYVKGSRKEPASSWMTSRFKEEAIENNINYIDAVLENLNLADKKVNLIGFSQGCETACRWAAKNTNKTNQLVLWAGKLSPDVSEEELVKKITLKQFVGKQDRLLSPNDYLKNVKRFDGGHEVSTELLTQHLFTDS